MDWKAVILISMACGLLVCATFGALTGGAVFYFGTGFGFTVFSRSRGFVADALFFFLWPLFIYADWKGGVL